MPHVYRSSDAYVDSVSLLADYSRVAELHTPHGHRHISEFTHTVGGGEAAQKIVALAGETTD